MKSLSKDSSSRAARAILCVSFCVGNYSEDDLTEAAEKEKALAVSHAENVSDWIQKLSSKSIDQPQRLMELQRQLKMPLIELWIAALLGGFSLEQRGEFYETADMWIGDRRSNR